MRRVSPFFNLCIALSIVFSCQSASSEEKISDSAFIITNVNIINVNDGSITQGHVVIDSTKIQDILDLNASVAKEYGTIIDGTDKYLLPGLAEMHAHIPSLSWEDPKIAETLFLYLSNGITTIRGMLGHPYHLELRAKAAN